MANSYWNVTGLAVQYGLNSAMRTLAPQVGCTFFLVSFVFFFFPSSSAMRFFVSKKKTYRRWAAGGAESYQASTCSEAPSSRS